MVWSVWTNAMPAETGHRWIAAWTSRVMSESSVRSPLETVREALKTFMVRSLPRHVARIGEHDSEASRPKSPCDHPRSVGAPQGQEVPYQGLPELCADEDFAGAGSRGRAETY